MQRETVSSFLSRIAAMNGVSCTDFALDMGFSVKRAIHLDERALRQLTICGDLSPDQLDELISWTGRQIGDVRTDFRGEVFVTRAIVNPVLRGCPTCLREDVQNDAANPLRYIVMRGHWQLRDVSVCLHHNHPLVPLREKSARTARYDYWLDGRLAASQDETWLAQHSLYAATTFCRLLGTELLRLDPPSSLDAIVQRQLAQARGFSVARQGEMAIRDALDALAAFSSGSHGGPQKAFGRLYINLKNEYVHDDAFEPFRGLLRNCILDVWPIAAG